MAVTFDIYPGDAVPTYTSGKHYAIFADAPLKVSSDQENEPNFLFKIEILDEDNKSLITCYRKATSYIGDEEPILELQLKTLLAGLVENEDPKPINQAYLEECTKGFVKHKIRVTEVYDVLGVPTEDATETKPDSGYFYGHNVAHENDPGMSEGLYTHIFLTNDAEGEIRLDSVKEILGWIDNGSASSVRIQAKVVAGDKVFYYSIPNQAGLITFPPETFDSGRISIPVNDNTIPLPGQVDNVELRFIKVVQPTSAPAVGAPDGAGALVTVDDSGEEAHVAAWKAGQAVRIDTYDDTPEPISTTYNKEHVIIEKVSDTSFYIAEAYDAGEVAKIDTFEVTLTDEFDAGENTGFATEINWQGNKKKFTTYSVMYQNHLGGLDVVDFISRDTEMVKAQTDKIRINDVKKRFGTRSANIITLSTNWIEAHNVENFSGLIGSDKHWLRIGNEWVEVLLHTERVKVHERRELVSMEVEIEMQDNLINR